MSDRLVTYNDSSYTRSWIEEDVGASLADELVKMNFTIRDANGLCKWMQSKCREKTPTLVVFVQDVAPDLIMKYPDSNALIRQYLDSGGSILWMGDMPCFFRAKKGITSTGELQHNDMNWYTTTPFITILGILPVISIPVHPVKINEKGKKVGIDSQWSGIRPIMTDKFITSLATSTSLIASEIISIRHINAFRRFINRIQRFEIGPTGGALELTNVPAVNDLSNSRTAFQTYSNAWFKNYNQTYPNSGFYRIWDHIISDYLLETKINELKNIIHELKSRLEIDQT